MSIFLLTCFMFYLIFWYNPVLQATLCFRPKNVAYDCNFEEKRLSHDVTHICYCIVIDLIRWTYSKSIVYCLLLTCLTLQYFTVNNWVAKQFNIDVPVSGKRIHKYKAMTKKNNDNRYKDRYRQTGSLTTDMRQHWNTVIMQTQL